MSIRFSYGPNGEVRRLYVEMHKPTGEKTAWGAPMVDYWSFSIETKCYRDSPHITKVTYVSEEDLDRVRAFVDELMKNEKPTPRFSLSQVHS